MIGFLDCHKYYPTGVQPRVVLYDTTCLFEPEERICILADSGAGKTTLIRLLAGLDTPTSGHVLRNEGISWPMGFAGAFHPAMTGEENIRTIATLGNSDPDWTSAYVAQFSELGDDYHRPLQGYSSGMRARLGMSLSLAIQENTYLADETIGTGDEQFRLKCEAALEQRLEKAGLFLVTRNPRVAERYGHRFGVLRNGRIVMCNDFAEAKAIFTSQENRFDELENLVASL